MSVVHMECTLSSYLITKTKVNSSVNTNNIEYRKSNTIGHQQLPIGRLDQLDRSFARLIEDRPSIVVGPGAEVKTIALRDFNGDALSGNQIVKGDVETLNRGMDNT